MHVWKCEIVEKGKTLGLWSSCQHTLLKMKSFWEHAAKSLWIELQDPGVGGRKCGFVTWRIFCHLILFFFFKFRTDTRINIWNWTQGKQIKNKTQPGPNTLLKSNQSKQPDVLKSRFVKYSQGNGLKCQITPRDVNALKHPHKILVCIITLKRFTCSDVQKTHHCPQTVRCCCSSFQPLSESLGFSSCLFKTPPPLPLPIKPSLFSLASWNTVLWLVKCLSRKCRPLISLYLSLLGGVSNKALGVN